VRALRSEAALALLPCDSGVYRLANVGPGAPLLHNGTAPTEPRTLPCDAVELGHPYRHPIRKALFRAYAAGKGRDRSRGV
jgi:hypothetical protein